MDANRAALATVGSRFAHMLRMVPDPTRPSVGFWSVGETAAHVASSASFFLAVARGEKEPERLDEVAADNAAFLASDPERDLRTLAERFEAGERALLAHVDRIDGDPPLELFEGVEVPLSTLLAVELAEVIVHGFDIARASGLTWRITRAEAAPAASGMLPLLPHAVDREAAAGRRARFELRIRGGSSATLEFAGGTLRLSPPIPQAVDCRISADPMVYLLLSFGRIGPLRPMVQGKLTAWGRRPWLAASFPSLFQSV
ncbi:MAG: maleylpyruvate isomerase family mycothiol-dependent enzyme [Actinomycetota bacterium]